MPRFHRTKKALGKVKTGATKVLAFFTGRLKKEERQSPDENAPEKEESDSSLPKGAIRSAARLRKREA